MIVCPNCNHLNPDGAVQCEACYTPLPTTTNCPSCGATVQADAAFCGQCGYNLHSNVVAATVAPETAVPMPPLVSPEPLFGLVQPDTLEVGNLEATAVSATLPPTAMAIAPPPPPIPVAPVSSEEPTIVAIPVSDPVIPPPPPPEPITAAEPTPVPTPAPVVNIARTQLQQVMARLFHVQSDLEIELPQNFSVIHIGKPNDRIPPDVDVSGFPNSEIVSRIHADIRIEGDAHYIEDVGSSNGTYINNLPLLPGNRHRLRPGDRISLGKGDLITFLFQLT
jgi:pSer/pThr/pTyr-binding forkhead associated (FHA) protein/ribosomal protein L40E